MRPAPITVLVAMFLVFVLAFCTTKACNGQCPGGVCPTSYTPVSAGHWTFPGPSIQSHLASDHGVSAAGMTQEQALSLHDSIHERARQTGFQPIANVRNQVKGLRGRFRLRR